MTNTTKHLLLLDGIPLNTYAKNIESLAGRLRTPPVKGGNVDVPGRHGQIWRPHKKFDQQTIVLPMWLQGTDDAGRIPSNTNAQKLFYGHLDALTQLFADRDKLRILEHVTPLGTRRRIQVEVLDVIDIDTSGWDGNRPLGKFTVAFNCPSPFWYSPVGRIQRFHFSGHSKTVRLTQWAPSTAPIDDLTVVFRGPLHNPRVIASNGTWIQYMDDIPNNANISINCATFEIGGSPAFPADERKFLHSGDPRWLVVPAGKIGNYVVDVEYAPTGPGTSGLHNKLITRPNAPMLTLRASDTGGVNSRVSFKGTNKFLVG